MNIKETLGIGGKALEGRDKTSAVEKEAARAAAKAGSESQASTTDKVVISGKSREMAKASEVLAGTSDVRAQKVADIKTRLENQDYQVDEQKIAHKMIVDFLEEIV